MENTTMKISFLVKVNNHSWLSPSGYSKWYQRHTEFLEGKLNQDDVYGYEQCIEHIAEYFGKQDEYKSSRNKDILNIERTIHIIDELDYTPIQPINLFKPKVYTIGETD